MLWSAIFAKLCRVQVNQRLDTSMTNAFTGIWDVHTQKKLPLRTSAFYVALQKVTRTPCRKYRK